MLRWIGIFLTVSLDEANLGWAMWDWKAGFRYWDAKASQPMPGLREALFSKTER